MRFVTLVTAGLLALFGAGAPAICTGPPKQIAVEAASHFLGWRVWWLRNRTILRVPAGRSGGAIESIRSFRSWLDSRRPQLLLAARASRPGQEMALLQLGLLGRSADIFKLLDAVRLKGRSGQAAILGLGLYGSGSTIGHLEALMRDTLTGRHLAGDLARSVPLSHRAAAAMSLGLTGVPSAYQALRIALKHDDLPDALGAAALVALSFSGAPSDGVRFEQCLRRVSDRPLMREAAAASLGRCAGHVPGARRLLLRVLEEEPESAGRGAAVALWFEDLGAPDSSGEGRALREAALSSRDPVTRVLALVALAGRGDPSAETAIEAVLRRPDPQRSFAIIATGLLAKADPSTAARGRARLARLQDEDPATVTVARRLLEDPELLARPQRGRSLAHLAGGNACFSGVGLLGSLLDMSACLGK